MSPLHYWNWQTYLHFRLVSHLFFLIIKTLFLSNRYFQRRAGTHNPEIKGHTLHPRSWSAPCAICLSVSFSWKHQQYLDIFYLFKTAYVLLKALLKLLRSLIYSVYDCFNILTEKKNIFTVVYLYVFNDFLYIFHQLL